MAVPEAQATFCGGVAYLERMLAELLSDTPFNKWRWHGLRRGGAAAAYHRARVVTYFVCWGRWRRFATSLEYVLGYSHPFVVGPLCLSCPGAAVGADGGHVWAVVNIWGEAMYQAGPRIGLRVAKGAACASGASVDGEELALLEHGLEGGAQLDSEDDNGLILRVCL